MCVNTVTAPPHTTKLHRLVSALEEPRQGRVKKRGTSPCVPAALGGGVEARKGCGAGAGGPSRARVLVARGRLQ